MKFGLENFPMECGDNGWTLLQGIEFIQVLEPVVALARCHTALTGSTLYKGQSKKGLDVMVYPHNTRDPLSLLDVNKVVAAIVKILKPISVKLCDQYGGYARDTKDVVSMHVVVDGVIKRVDFFFVEFSNTVTKAHNK